MISEREREYHRRLIIIKGVLETERSNLSADEYFEKYGTYHISDKIEKFKTGQHRIINFLLATTIINATGNMTKELLFLLLGITCISTIVFLVRNSN